MLNPKYLKGRSPSTTNTKKFGDALEESTQNRSARRSGQKNGATDRRQKKDSPKAKAILPQISQYFTIFADQDYISLCDLLHASGVTESGGAGKMLVASGEVYVDGVVELRKTCKIRAGMVVTGNGYKILVAKEILEID